MIAIWAGIFYVSFAVRFELAQMLFVSLGKALRFLLHRALDMRQVCFV